MEVHFLFDCINCDYKQLKIIEVYESLWFSLKPATNDQKQALVNLGAFSYEALFKDYSVSVKQFSYEDKKLLCVEWSRIHFFYELL